MNSITHNWSEHVAFGARAVHFPTSVAAVQALVHGADKVRVVGARHSFNAIADTTGDLISLRRLERLISIDAAARTVRIDGGLTYAELCPVLDAAGWALSNLASVPDFTVAGAVATATHGSGSDNRNLGGAVAAVELVTASGDLVRLARGDAGFDGAVVNLGALGVVVALTLDLVPRFDVAQTVFHRLPFDRVVRDFDALMASAYSVSLFTHWRGDVVDQAWVKALTPLPAGDFFGGTPAPGPWSPVWGNDPTGTTAQMGVPGTWYDRLTHGRIGAIPSTGREVQAEYFVARADAPAALRALKAVQEQLHPALIVSEIRSVAADRQWLSMNYERDSVGIHFAFGRDWPSVSRALGVIETALAPFAPRPHWGKLFVMPPAAVQTLYPRLGDFRSLARQLDPVGKFRNPFLDAHVFGG